MNEISIVIAETKPLLRVGIKSIFSKFGWIKLQGEINQAQHLNDLLQAVNPDVLVVGIDTHSGLKYELLPDLLQSHPGFNFLVILESCEIHLATKIMATGISNIVTSNSSPEELIEGLEAARDGKPYFAGSVQRYIYKDDSSIISGNGLSEREIQVIKLMSKGYTNAEIAGQLFLSKHTISTHRKNILKKLKVHHISDVLRFAIKQRLITTF